VITLRRQVSDLARSVERIAGQSLEPALKELVSKIEDSRAAGVSETSLAPILSLLSAMQSSLKNAPSIMARAMREDLETINLRLDHLAESGIDAMAFTLLRQQVESMARSLSELAARMAKQDQLEQQIRTLTARIEEMAAVPREIAGRLVELVEGMRRSIDRLDTSPALRALEKRVEQAIKEQTDVPPVVEHVLADMRRAIDTLAEHPALTTIQKRMADLAQSSQHFPQQIIETLTHLRHSIERIADNPSLAKIEEKLHEISSRATPTNSALTESLSEIRLSIERLAANAGLRGAGEHLQRLETIEQRVSQIAEKLDTPPFLQKFESLHRDMLNRLERASATMPDDQVVAILNRVSELREALAQPTSNRLEELIAQLNAKVERVTGAGAPDPRAMQSIENQLQRIAERMERNGGSVDAIDTIERSIGDVVAQIARTRQSSSASEDTLRTLQDQSEQRTQATLNAVHETLEKVVDRLAMLESDLGSRHVREPEEVPAVTAAQPDSATDMATEPAAPPLVTLAAPEVLIEPGTGFTPPLMTRAAETEAAGSIQETTSARQDMSLDIEEPRAAKASFIAAARRATQLSGSPPPPVRNDEESVIARARAKAAAEKVDTGNERAADAIRKTVYGCTALAMILAGWQFAQGPKRPRPIMQSAIESPLTAQALINANPAQSRTTEEMLLELAQNGQAAAQHEMASRLLEGRNMARDPAQALGWFQKSAEQNYAPAQYKLGTLFEKGVGVSADMKTAAIWYGRAAEAGHVRAMHNLGVLLADGIDGKPDYAGAARLFRKAAEHGLRDSQYNLAVLHMRGLGVETNLVEAYKWFSLAGKQGDADADLKRDEIAQRLQPRQLGEARQATETFAQVSPDPAINEPIAAENIVSANPAAAAQQGRRTRDHAAMSDSFKTDTMPASALLLGVGGLIPFFGLALWQGTSVDELLADRLTMAYVFYAASILSFLGGIGWGLAMSERDPLQRGLSFGVSIVPALIGWPAAFINVQNLGFSLGILAAAFVLQGAWDWHLVNRARAPRWFGTLRLGLTVAVIASMTLLWFTQTDFSAL
jgi:localization factor PodJL